MDKTRASCLAECKRRVPQATGCELNSRGKCSIHTKPVSGGSGTSGYTCNVFELRFVNEGFGIPAFEGGEPREGNIGLWEDTSGNCLNSEGKYQETGTIRVGERTSSPDSVCPSAREFLAQLGVNSKTSITDLVPYIRSLLLGEKKPLPLAMCGRRLLFWDEYDKFHL
eukprot:TRINITY_DN1402_c0_g1_i12.p1 TRINITY_DN1402_c0_g1~~TRINITY_DN1402_c0_g1_i12.p1  ORF type:complete len:168 (-),score=1.32 TRINITY_DN1402_c0_g1_i12:106-609(-)